MKKKLIGALVGGLVIFIWQFISFAAANFHKPAQQYTPKQDAIVQFMNTQGLADGGYILPSLPDNATADDHQKIMTDMQGKPWMSVQYHNSFDQNMYLNMVRGYVIDVVLVFLFITLLLKMGPVTMGRAVGSAVIIGLIVFLNAAYTNHIWYQTFDIWAHFADAVISWSLVGLWLGFILKGKVKEGNKSSWEREREKAIA